MIEEALREHVATRRKEAGQRMLHLLEEIAEWQEREGVPRLSDEEAMALASEELRAVRAERKRRQTVVLRVVVDPDALISAVLPPLGIPGRAVEAARGGRYLLVVSPLLPDEVDEVLARDRLRRSAS